MMRVNNIYRNVKLVVKGDGKVIKEIKRPHVAPGEMEIIRLSLNELSSQDYSEISVEIAKEGE